MTEHDNVVNEQAEKRARLGKWFHSVLGLRVTRLEKNRLGQVLPGLFGYHIVQIGEFAAEHLLETSRINHKIHSAVDFPAEDGPGPDFLSSHVALPIASESVDVVVLPHVLEFDDNPHQVLRECERILIGEGHIVITVFNPWSLWGLWRLLLAWREQPPWQGRYYRVNRVKDWLTLLDFEIIKSEYFFYRPPLQNNRIMSKLRFMEQLGRYCWPVFGGIVMLVAKKRVIPLTPIKMQWQTRRQLIASGVAEPSARMNRYT